MVLTVQTQVTCPIHESENPRMPNASASKATEVYDFLTVRIYIRVLSTAHKTL